MGYPQRGFGLAVAAASSLVLIGCDGDSDGAEAVAPADEETTQTVEGEFGAVEIPGGWVETDISWLEDISGDSRVFQSFHGGELHEVTTAYGEAAGAEDATWQVAIFDSENTVRSLTGDVQDYLGAETTTEPNRLWDPEERPEWLRLPEDPDFMYYHKLAFLMDECPLAESCEAAVVGVGHRPAMGVLVIADEIDEETFTAIEDSIDVDGLDMDEIRGF
ncbi:hypothetical protein HGQ17_13085 [Nesterenkonia sp. MY13]|uniref:Lipoprotein n=1 Tax=Nesterenkonia sedimenti TaxID=1463632 RepID=A0A7X8TLC8_9MICC|nr:hypothetical protein [Nesterenkonia sedimenti]NLS10910.1 hypothetical protein [Nesterenkonia sedimenti]